MIATITTYIAERLRKILHQGSPIKVYEPGEDRDKDETVYPHLAIVIKALKPDAALSGPHCQLLEPSAEQQTITVPAWFGGNFAAVITGSLAGPFAIVKDSADTIALRIGRDGKWKKIYTVKLIAGSRDAWEVCGAISAVTDDVMPSVDAGRVRLETEPGYDLEILAVDHDAYAALGFAPVVVSHLTQTGPANYGVKEHPAAVIVTYQIWIQAAEDTQRHKLEQFVLDRFPDGHWPRIGGIAHAPLFKLMDIDVDDEAALPEFCTIKEYEVSQVWIDRLTDFDVPAISDITLDLSA